MFALGLPTLGDLDFAPDHNHTGGLYVETSSSSESCASLSVHELCLYLSGWVWLTPTVSEY